MSEKPLITFILLSYNQEHYIRDAVEGLFSQTYSPLEIILSDDCSPDRTYEIMQEMAATYQGPHKIVLNRKETNQGITDHVNEAVRLSAGKLILVAAGDDVSHPERTEKTVAAWMSSGQPVGSLFTNTIIINEDGKELFIYNPKGYSWEAKSLEEAIRRTSTGISGCSHAFHPALFEIFGQLHPGGMVEDNAIGFRSLLLGGIYFIDEPLVKYREHGSSVKKGRRAKLCDLELAYLMGWANDIKTAEEKSLISVERAEILTRQLGQQILLHELEQLCHQNGFARSILRLMTNLNSHRESKLMAQAAYRAFTPVAVKRAWKFVSYDLRNPRDGLKKVWRFFRTEPKY